MGNDNSTQTQSLLLSSSLDESYYSTVSSINNNDNNRSSQEHEQLEDQEICFHEKGMESNGSLILTNGDGEERYLSFWNITCILSTAFAYGCIMTTLFLITLPVECERIEEQHPNFPKSVALGVFVSIAGLTQLISPLVGMLSDTYHPPLHFQLGQRLPYLVLGAILSVVGLLGQYMKSFQRLWLQYGFFFFLHMIGLNITYGMMIALIPDQVPTTQTGVANGMLAFMLVTGSLFGFGLFHAFFGRSIQDMYGLYICIVTVTTVMTATHAHNRDAELTALRMSFSGREEETRTLGGLLTPWILFRTMLYDPIAALDSKTLLASYTIDVEKHHDFFVVTVSRLMYYCGMSVQTFFLYFLHDIIRVTEDPESAVAYLAILAQVSGTFTTYPIGLISDRLCHGRRKPFVYLACAILGSLVLCMTFATTMDQMIILCLILGSANGIYLTMDTSLAVDTLPQSYHDGSSGGNAQLLGIWGVAAFLGTALGPMIGGPLLYLIGAMPPTENQNSEDPAYSLSGYAVIMGLSSLYFVSSAFALRWIKNTEV